MSEYRLNTPVALIVFNRPSPTSRVFEAIRKARPRKLLLIADGPRPDRNGEAEKCAAVRAIIETVDWDCDVFKNYSDENLGCGLRPSTGIDWVFSQVDEVIILEDDCLPHPDFFRFCDELLEYYRSDQRVMHISGVNFLFDYREGRDSYLFSRYPFCWGWATWRRAWKHFDHDATIWPTLKREGGLEELFDGFSPRARRYWEGVFEYVHNNGKSHIWDFQWVMACWLNKGLSVIPSVNLVSNIGFGEDATHTRNFEDKLRNFIPGVSLIAGDIISRLTGSRFANLPVEEMKFPLSHPSNIIRDEFADEYLQFNNYEGGRWGRVRRKMKKILSNI